MSTACDGSLSVRIINAIVNFWFIILATDCKND